MERTCRCDVRYLVELYTNLASESAVTASCSSNGFKNRKEDWFVEVIDRCVNLIQNILSHVFSFKRNSSELIAPKVP